MIIPFTAAEIFVGPDAFIIPCKDCNEELLNKKIAYTGEGAANARNLKGMDVGSG